MINVKQNSMNDTRIILLAVKKSPLIQYKNP